MSRHRLIGGARQRHQLDRRDHPTGLCRRSASCATGRTSGWPSPRRARRRGRPGGQRDVVAAGRSLHRDRHPGGRGPIHGVGGTPQRAAPGARPAEARLPADLGVELALAGEHLRALDLEGRFGATVTRVRRGDADLVADSDFHLRLGDRLRVVGPGDRMGEIAALFGDSDRSLGEVDAMGLRSDWRSGWRSA